MTKQNEKKIYKNLGSPRAAGLHDAELGGMGTNEGRSNRVIP